MDSQILTLAAYGLAAAALGAAAVKAKNRLALSRAKHASLTGHSRMARRVAGLVPFYEYDRHRFFRADDPPEDVAARRQAGFERLADIFAQRFAKTRTLSSKVREGLSD